MTELLQGALALKARRPVLGGPIPVRLTVTNVAGEPLIVPSPDLGLPPAELRWPASAEAFRASLLMSFGVLELTLGAADGSPVATRGLAPWVTPVLARTTLRPGESLGLDLDLGELFAIDAAGRYTLRARYGDEGLKAAAGMELTLSPPGARGAGGERSG